MIGSHDVRNDGARVVLEHFEQGKRRGFTEQTRLILEDFLRRFSGNFQPTIQPSTARELKTHRFFSIKPNRQVEWLDKPFS